MTLDRNVTGASFAIHSTMHRFLVDLMLRDDMARRASERKSKKRGCHCQDPHSNSNETPKFSEVRPYVRKIDPGGTIVSSLPVTFLGALSKSRLLSVYEIFEIPASIDVQSARMEEVDENLEENCSALFLDSQKWEKTKHMGESIWALRQNAIEIFQSGLRKPADIIRLTLAADLVATPPENGCWSFLSQRDFHLGGGYWRSAFVYEANSADLDKVRIRT